MSISQNFPTIRPTLNLNFARSKTLDPRITFTRASTATYVDEDGLIKTASADEPRFDHNPVTGESLGLLIEESRTNYYTTSETLTNSRTGPSSGMIYTDFTTDGPQGGRFTRVVRNTSLSRTSDWDWQIEYSNVGLSIGQQFVVTFYARCPNGTLSSIKLSNPDAEGEVFNIDSTWRRFTKVFTYGVQSGLTFFRFNRAHTPAYVNGATYDLAALQIENRPFPTSYIPTSGSTVTRQPDYAKITGTNFTDFYNSSEGTLFAESSFADLTTANQGTVQLWYSSTNHIGMGYRWGGSGSGTYGFYIRNTADQLYRSPSGVTANTFVKASLAYKSNDGASSLNGETAVVDTSINLPTAATEMTIGYGNASPSTYRMKQGHIKSLTYYNKRLTNDQLQNLTK